MPRPYSVDAPVLTAIPCAIVGIVPEIVYTPYTRRAAYLSKPVVVNGDAMRESFRNRFDPLVKQLCFFCHPNLNLNSMAWRESLKKNKRPCGP